MESNNMNDMNSDSLQDLIKSGVSCDRARCASDTATMVPNQNKQPHATTGDGESGGKKSWRTMFSKQNSSEDGRRVTISGSSPTKHQTYGLFEFFASLTRSPSSESMSSSSSSSTFHDAAKSTSSSPISFLDDDGVIDTQLRKSKQIRTISSINDFAVHSSGIGL
eukprot:m.79409 g.79409  ORF g.79409 m.79409 type:complete len:165 (-) comp8603_c1_seq1:143-637(-)